MGSRSSAKDEDEAAQRHSHRPPSSRISERHAAPFPDPPQFRAHETVINGTTWYYPPPSHLHGRGRPDSHTHPPPRYANLPIFNSAGFDSSPRSHPRHHRAPPPRPYPPHASVRTPFFDGCTSGFMPPYPYDDRPHQRNGPHRPPPRYFGDGAYGFMPSYHHNMGVCEGMPQYPHGSGRSYMDSAMPSPVRSHCIVMPSPDRASGSMVSPATAHASHDLDYNTHGMPPHAIQTAGKTFRHVVSWSGMNMPVIITSQAGAVVEWIQRQSGDLFGFDVEWKPNRFKGEDNMIALLQICGPSDCLIVQLLYTDMIPKMLKEFLVNAKKYLGGVGIRQDVDKLERDHDLACQGQVELGTLASEKLQRHDLQKTGLKNLVEQVLGMTLVKAKKITMSDWEKEYLDMKQIEYACIDAWAAFAILEKLMTL